MQIAGYQFTYWQLGLAVLALAVVGFVLYRWHFAAPAASFHYPPPSPLQSAQQEDESGQQSGAAQPLTPPRGGQMGR